MNNSKHARIFFCHHPASLILFKNLAQLIREYSEGYRVILVKAGHPYFKEFDFAPYAGCFDEIHELNAVAYDKNIARGFKECAIYRAAALKLMATWKAAFKDINLFLMNSAWLPANLFLYLFNTNLPSASITRFLLSPDMEDLNTDALRNLFTELFRAFQNGYAVKTICSPKTRKLLDFKYTVPVPGRIVFLRTPESKTAGQNVDSIEYPLYHKKEENERRDSVYIFGDATLYDFYSDYLPEKDKFRKLLKEFFRGLEEHYAGMRLFYKPHPGDGQNKMEGPDYDKYTVLGQEHNAEVIMDRAKGNITAVYAFASTALITAAYYRIPAYSFYRYFCNQTGRDRFDGMFNRAHIESPYIKHVSERAQIGGIDHLPELLKNKEDTSRQKYKLILGIN